MASNAIPSTPAVTVEVPTPSTLPATNGKSLPPSGNSAQAAVQGAAAAQRATVSAAANAAATAPTRTAAASTAAAATSQSTLQPLVTLLNKFLNDTGRPDQYRLDPTDPEQTIQEINPSNGQVIAEFSSTDFPALARSLGISGALLDSHA